MTYDADYEKEQEWIPIWARKRITDLEEEIDRLRNQEALKDIALGEIEDLKHQLNEERNKVGELRDALDGMATDMSLMEDRIAELSGRTGITPDYE